MIPTIDADFNARTKDDRVRLDTLGSSRSIAEHGGVIVGQMILLSDGEVQTEAIVEYRDGALVARVVAGSWHLCPSARKMLRR